MKFLEPEYEVVDHAVRARTIAHFRERNIGLPTLSELVDPTTIDERLQTTLGTIDPDTPEALNLYRVHWYNGVEARHPVPVPDHIVLPAELTGIASPIVVVYGDRFPMIHAHKVLPAYSCIVSRLVTGGFDPTHHRAIWPSTGNYCRGGVAISRILGCRAVAVLPEGMSDERFRWLKAWVAGPADIVRTVGTESNVKEIYDKCADLENDADNIVFNQFREFANHLIHYEATGRALEHVFETVQKQHPSMRLAGFLAATGSAGTLAAGDYLKDRHGTKIIAAEALECPTMLYNGFGEHNIQGIGDKHIPLIHNVTNTDVVVAVSDQSTDALNIVFNTEAGHSYLREALGLAPELIGELASFGLSSICNVVGAIKTAKQLELGPDDALITVATDGAELYRTELDKATPRIFPDGLDRAAAERSFETHLLGASTEHVLELSPIDRDRIFNLGYFTWVEQQGVSLEDFERRRSQRFWTELRELVSLWDRRIEEFNQETGVILER
jgi:cysteine synthase A